MKELVAASAVSVVIAVLVVLIVPELDFAGAGDAATDGGPAVAVPTQPGGGGANGGAGDGAQGAELGQQLVSQLGCLGCHSTGTETLVGPGWGGLFGSTETLADGSTVQVDEAYIRESILQPDAKVVEGFQPGIMPAFEGQVSDEELNAIVEYIQTLQ